MTEKFAIIEVLELQAVTTEELLSSGRVVAHPSVTHR